MLRLFKDICRECEVFIKIMRFFGGFNKKSKAFSKITRLFKEIFNGIEAFLK
jgi:hypothetical protein